MAIVAFAIGCQNDTSSYTAGESEGTTLSISLEQTRTSLGQKGDNGIYPAYWSEGDKIVVNGELSGEAQIDATNRGSATFHLSQSLSSPYCITYPYCAATTAERSIVEFASEQSYAEGTFSTATAPMCGYAESSSDNISLSHLSTVLHFPIKASYEGVVLDKVVITSTSEAKLSGKFEVDCKNATISATEGCESVVTYTLPADYTLSTSTASDLFIVLPAVEVGTCKIEFVETSGKKMVTTWNPSAPLSKGVVREFTTITYHQGVVGGLSSLDSYEDVFEIPYKKFAGSDELKIMSFNVRTECNETDPNNNWVNRKEACVELIKDQKPGVIGFQEADFTNQWTYLKDQLSKDYAGYGVNRDNGKESGGGETMGILYNKRIIEKIDGGTFWLSETPDTPSKGFGADYYRNATWGLFKHLPSGVTFYYINTHLDHKVAEAQIKGMELISQHFEAMRDTYPVFLTGDLNIKADNVALDVIEVYMNNAREVAPEVLTDFDTTYNGYQTGKDTIIDHIYCSKYLKVAEYHTVDEDYGVPFVSDHYPVYAIVKLK